MAEHFHQLEFTMNRRVGMQILAPVAVLAVCCPTGAFAFGADAHEAICEIAYRELTPAAKGRVDRLIVLDKDSRVDTFRESCVWPDFKDRIQEERRRDHYINVPRSWTSIRQQRCHNADRCLFTAIADDVSILSSQETNDGEKLVAIKFLGHWVGDIHQPLHVSYKDDRGGNNILVEGVKGCARKGQTKLHTVWDICIPKDIMQELGVARSASGDPREAFGKLLHEKITPDQRQAWLASPTPLDWANESLALARRADFGYCYLKDSKCVYSEENDEYRENGDAPNNRMRVFEPEGDYEDRFKDVVTRRIQAAGVRLGGMLNTIFGNQPEN